MGIAGIDHINIDTDRIDETEAFYVDVLGLEARPKPSGVAGVWLYVDDHPIIHVNIVDDDRRDQPTGAFNHVALAATGFDELTERLRAGGFDYQVFERPQRQLTQIFTTDPNGVSIELNIPD